MVRRPLVQTRGDVFSGASPYPVGDEGGVQPVVAAQGAEAVVGIDDLPGNPRRYFRAAQGGMDDAYRNAEPFTEFFAEVVAAIGPEAAGELTAHCPL